MTSLLSLTPMGAPPKPAIISEPLMPRVNYTAGSQRRLKCRQEFVVSESSAETGWEGVADNRIYEWTLYIHTPILYQYYYEFIFSGIICKQVGRSHGPVGGGGGATQPMNVGNNCGTSRPPFWDFTIYKTGIFITTAAIFGRFFLNCFSPEGGKAVETLFGEI